MKTSNARKESREIVESIRAMIQTYLRKRPKGQSELYDWLCTDFRTVHSIRTKRVLKTLLEIMYEECGGASPPEFDTIAPPQIVRDGKLAEFEYLDFEN